MEACATPTARPRSSCDRLPRTCRRIWPNRSRAFWSIRKNSIDYVGPYVYSPDMDSTARIRGRMAEIGVTQQDLADHLGINPTLMNHILNGRRPAPPDFEANATAALDLLEAAEEAAQKERARVLAGAGQ